MSRDFGACCNDLREAMTAPQKRFLKVSREGILYLTVGSVQTELGSGWMEQAIFYCPFCGCQLQTREQIQRLSVPGSSMLQ